MARRRLVLNGVVAECVRDPDTGDSKLHFKFEDTTIRVSEGKEEIGHIVGCIGGIELKDNRVPGDSFDGLFSLDIPSLWDSFQRALNEKQTGNIEGP